jgi:hypothetical protein
MAVSMLQQLHPENSIPQLGKNWTQRFLKRYPDLVSKFAKPLDKARAQATSENVLRDHFKKVLVFKIFY